MTAMRIMALIIVMLIMGTNTYGANPSATEILKEVATKYKTMKTYKSEGKRISVDKSSIGAGRTELTFTILLKKPNLYLITWTSATSLPGDRAALWSDGSQTYFYRMHTFGKMTSEEMNVKIAANFGMPYTIPGLFLPDFKRDEGPFFWLKNPKVEKIEKIEGEDCYVISGSSAVSKRETIWVSKTRYLIRKYERSIEPPEEGRRWPGMTHKEKEREKLYVEEFKRRKMSGFYSEVYTEISSPELKKEDFNFTVPEGTVFRDDWPKD